MFRGLEGNIYKLYVLKISHWLSLVMPIIVLFYYDNKLSMQDVFILQAVYSVSIVVLEIPTGYFADVWGRKNTLIIGAFLGFIGFGIYSVSHGFWGFLFAEMTLGISQSFVSGTDSALLYDSMLALKRENDYLKYEGRVTSVGNFAEAIAGILGGLLATISLRTPFFFQTIIAMLAIPAALTVVEPQLHYEKIKMTFKDIIRVFRQTLFENKILSRNIMLSSVIGASTLTMAWFIQPFFKILQIPVAIYGILWTILNFIVGLGSLISYKTERVLGSKRTILLIITFITLGYLGMGIFHSYFAFVFIVFFYIIRGTATPILKDYINKLTPSEIRATVLSIRNLIIRFIFSGIGPILGWATDKISLQTALLMAGGIYFLLSLPFVILFLKK